MTALAFVPLSDQGSALCCHFDEGRIILEAEADQGISSCVFALARPDGVSPAAIEFALLKAPAGTPERERLAQTLPARGAEIGWFVSAADGAELLAAAAAAPVTADAESQLTAAGFKPYLCEEGGRKCYVRRTGKGAGSDAFHLAVSPDGVRLTFERPATIETLLVLHSRTLTSRGPVHTAVPDFLGSIDAMVAVAIGQADRFLASGGRKRRPRAA